MRIVFVEERCAPPAEIFEYDTSSAPHKDDVIEIGPDTYSVTSVHHVFEPTERAGQFGYEVRVQVQNISR